MIDLMSLLPSLLSRCVSLRSLSGATARHSGRLRLIRDCCDLEEKFGTLYNQLPPNLKTITITDTDQELLGSAAPNAAFPKSYMFTSLSAAHMHMMYWASCRSYITWLNFFCRPPWVSEPHATGQIILRPCAFHHVSLHSRCLQMKTLMAVGVASLQRRRNTVCQKRGHWRKATHLPKRPPTFVCLFSTAWSKTLSSWAILYTISAQNGHRGIYIMSACRSCTAALVLRNDRHARDERVEV